MGKEKQGAKKEEKKGKRMRKLEREGREEGRRMEGRNGHDRESPFSNSWMRPGSAGCKSTGRGVRVAES